jgi:hypothetical protein
LLPDPTDVNSFGGLAGYLGLLELFGGILTTGSFAALFVIVVVSSRAEPDPTGLRPGTVYMLSTSFFGIIVALVSSIVAVGALTSMIGRRVGTGFGTHEVGNQVARVVVLSLLIGGAAALAFAFHASRARRAARWELAQLGHPGPVLRVWQSYIAAVSFVCVGIMLLAGIVGAYQVFRLAGPGVFNGNSHHSVIPVRVLLVSVYALGAAGLVRVAHQRLVLVRPPRPEPPPPPPLFAPPPSGPSPYDPSAASPYAPPSESPSPSPSGPAAPSPFEPPPHEPVPAPVQDADPYSPS